MARPLILVTNDDGIFAPGIKALISVAEELGDVYVVAPDKPQSGMGHAITVGNIVRLHPTDYYKKVKKAFMCSGTPVDCVKLAIAHVLPRKPDLILSGINHGANNSINVIYSGTMSAAVEGAMEGVPSLGFSHANYQYDLDFTGLGAYIKKLCENALKEDFPHKTCLNVNFPDVPASELKGIKICRQAEAHWSDSFEKRLDPSGKEYYWLTGVFEGKDKGTDTDIWALNNNYVSVVPTQFDLTAHHEISNLNTWNYEI
ncbi:5'/3'-nucleotidase SurE [Luteibaculum oceani]|uniref:5'-nucleotidase SurE n=1 Tax=Luteibaculum oceani TaxID=1294296 RepID=A0A5C6VA35_9FLAO|nr:5'/3'-nucleotidase SurE [Luteibaculum oceani]TXC81341.1 5'/3'-nucleotidase SurE [Luteibaculum oceani]